jgi:alpha-beta hydrolase superfamily lysophospholipase
MDKGLVGARATLAPSLETIQAADGYSVQFERYSVEGNPRAVVVGVHGIQSHSGWYQASSAALAAAGFETYFFNRRGSGPHTRDRGDCQGHRQLCDDLIQAVAHVRQARPAAPVAIIAISWGAKVALATLAREPRLADAAAFLAPGWFPQVGLSLKDRLRIAWSVLTAPSRRFPIPLDDPTLFTENPRWQEFLRRDPLSLREATARLFLASRRLDLAIRGAPRRMCIPCMLALAGNDRIIVNERTRKFFAGFASSQKTVREYPNASHTLEFELDPVPIFGDVIDWLGSVFG